MTDRYPGFFETLARTLKGGICNKDTVVIYVLAVAFYLIFYAWPYGNQQIEHIPTAIVDLDNSAASRRLIQELDASPAIALTAVFHTEKDGMTALRRESVPVILTIPENYERNLIQTDNTTLHLVGNGIYPVKVRAVQAAVGALVQDKARLLDMAPVFATGLPGATVTESQTATPSLAVQYRFNNIGGYANYTVPAVSPVILQAVMLMAITMTLGGWLGTSRRPDFIQGALAYPLRLGVAVFSAYWCMAYTWFVYIQGFDFWFFEYGSLVNAPLTFAAGALYCASVVSFGLMIAMLLGSNRWSTQTVVLMSAPSVFLSGAIWPAEAISSVWIYGFSLLMPSTPGIRSILAASQDNAMLSDVVLPLSVMLLQTVIYLTIAGLLTRRRLNVTAS